MMLIHVTIVVKDQNKHLNSTLERWVSRRRPITRILASPDGSRLARRGTHRDDIMARGYGIRSEFAGSHKQLGIGTRWVLEVDDVRTIFAEMKARGSEVLGPTASRLGPGFFSRPRRS